MRPRLGLKVRVALLVARSVGLVVGDGERLRVYVAAWEEEAVAVTVDADRLALQLTRVGVRLRLRVDVKLRDTGLAVLRPDGVELADAEGDPDRGRLRVEVGVVVRVRRTVAVRVATTVSEAVGGTVRVRL